MLLLFSSLPNIQCSFSAYLLCFLKLLILDVIPPQHQSAFPKSLICILTLSSSEASSSRLFRAFSTLAKRPDRDSRRLTTLSRSPTNIRNFSSSLGLQTPWTMTSTSSPRALLSCTSSCRLSWASLSTCNFLLRLSINSCCKEKGKQRQSHLD